MDGIAPGGVYVNVSAGDHVDKNVGWLRGLLL
jgi:hypothetical protein